MEGAQPVSTRDGVALGTPEYMSPEQWLGAARVDGKADVYSLGVVLYETLCGAPPFVASNSDKLRSLHLYEPPPPVRRRAKDVPVAFGELIDKMLAKTLAERPPMAEVASRLGALLEAHDVPSPLPSMVSQEEKNLPVPQPEPPRTPFTSLFTREAGTEGPPAVWRNCAASCSPSPPASSWAASCCSSSCSCVGREPIHKPTAGPIRPVVRHRSISGARRPLRAGDRPAWAPRYGLWIGS
jgi:serine/threonine protein kinase